MEIIKDDEIRDGYDPIISQKILAALLLKSNRDNKYEFWENEFESFFELKGFNDSIIEDYLNYFSSIGIIEFEGFGEGDNYVHFWGKISESAKEHYIKVILKEIEDYIKDLKLEINKVELEKAKIMQYNPTKIKSELSNVKEQLELFLNHSANNPILNGVLPIVEDLNSYVNSIEGINDTYESVYLNIIKPIKIESQQGVKATVKWAIISIVISTFISLIITNWSNINLLF